MSLTSFALFGYRLLNAEAVDGERWEFAPPVPGIVVGVTLIAGALQGNVIGAGSFPARQSGGVTCLATGIRGLLLMEPRSLGLPRPGGWSIEVLAAVIAVSSIVVIRVRARR